MGMGWGGGKVESEWSLYIFFGLLIVESDSFR